MDKEFLSSTDLERLTGTRASTWYWASIGHGPDSFRLGRRRVWPRAKASAWLAEQEAGDRHGRCPVIRTMRPNVEQSSRDLLEDLALPRVDDQPTAEARQRSYQKVRPLRRSGRPLLGMTKLSRSDRTLLGIGLAAGIR